MRAGNLDVFRTLNPDNRWRPMLHQIMSGVRIGLVRHFEVRRGMPSGWRTAAEIHQWRQEYDGSEIVPQEVALGDTAWRHCLSSDLPRAYLTAQSIFAGPVTQIPHLREVEIEPFDTGRFRLPVLAWRWLVQAAWLTSHRSQRAAKERFLANVRHVAREILHPRTEHTLVVSHGVMMMFLRRELLALGNSGPRFKLAEHGKLYVFERPTSSSQQKRSQE